MLTASMATASQWSLRANPSTKVSSIPLLRESSGRLWRLRRLGRNSCSGQVSQHGVMKTRSVLVQPEVALVIFCGQCVGYGMGKLRAPAWMVAMPVGGFLTIAPRLLELFSSSFRRLGAEVRALRCALGSSST